MDWVGLVLNAVKTAFSGGATFGLSEVIKIIAGLVLIVSTWYLGRALKRLRQGAIDRQEKENSEEQREDTQDGHQKRREDLKERRPDVNGQG